MPLPYCPDRQLRAFIDAAQCFAGLSYSSDLWREATKVLVNFFSADFAAFGRWGKWGPEVVQPVSSRDEVALQLKERELAAAVLAVYESGFHTCFCATAEEPMEVAAVPIVHEGHVLTVMLVGHLSPHPLPKELLDTYLGVAGIIGATYSRRIFESRVLQAKEDWERTFDAVPDLIALLDRDFRIVRANKAMAQRLGLTPAQCIGRFCYREVHGAEAPPPFCPYRAVLESGEDRHMEICLDRLDGHFDITVAPLRSKEGCLVGGVHVARDVTEQIEAQEKLREKDRIMMQQSRLAAMGEMVGNIAHQWRQPLNTLGLIIQEFPLMCETGDFKPESVDRSVNSAMGLVQHMSQTINDFSNFFKPEKKKVLFDVRKVIRKTVAIMEGSLSGVAIEFGGDPGEPLTVRGYPNEYSQVLLNILTNAKDAFAEQQVAQPELRIWSGVRGGMAVVTVADNAGGIPLEIMEKVFDPYFTTKGPDKGTGVGLFMSKTIIEKNMEGRLAVQNTPHGAEFSIEVQLETAEQALA